MHTSKSLLFHKSQAWVKKGKSSIDITMGGYGGPEKSDVVGLYMLDKLAKLLDLDAGLNRDDGHYIQANLKFINFLDIEVDPATGEHRPYIILNNTILYINVNSNYPKHVINKTALAVKRRISQLSSSETIFKQAIPQTQAPSKIPERDWIEQIHLGAEGKGHWILFEMETNR